MNRHKKILIGKALILVALLVCGLTVVGCIGFGSGQLGWSGATIDNGTVYLGSVGEIVALDTSDGNIIWDETIETPGSSGGFGCAVPATAVAIYGNLAVDGELVYIGGSDGKVYAFRFGKGEWEWSYPREGGIGSIIGGLVFAQGKVYFGSSNGKVYALEAEGLFEVWEKPFETKDAIWSTPTIDGNTLFIGSFDKKLYAIDVTTGKAKWAEPFDEAKGPIITTPLVYNNIVYIGSFDRYLYAVDAATGELVWQFPDTDEAEARPGKWFWASPVVYNNTIYAPNMDGNVYILDAESGAMINALDLGSPISSSPTVANGRVIVATEEGKVYSIDTSNNQSEELRDLGLKILAPLAASDGTIYVHTQEEETIYALDVDTGAILWNTPLVSE
jgi:outer membrane protein assembly factor BamB